MEETGNEGRKGRREVRRGGGEMKASRQRMVWLVLSGPAWERRRKTVGGSAVFSLKGWRGSVSLRVLRQPRTARLCTQLDSYQLGSH